MPTAHPPNTFHCVNLMMHIFGKTHFHRIKFSVTVMLLLINSEMPVNNTFQKSKAAQVVINVHVFTQQYTIYPNGNIILQFTFTHPNSFK